MFETIMGKDWYRSKVRIRRKGVTVIGKIRGNSQWANCALLFLTVGPSME